LVLIPFHGRPDHLRPAPIARPTMATQKARGEIVWGEEPIGLSRLNACIAQYSTFYELKLPVD
jgi:hypothetical protein